MNGKRGVKGPYRSLGERGVTKPRMSRVRGRGKRKKHPLREIRHTSKGVYMFHVVLLFVFESCRVEIL